MMEIRPRTTDERWRMLLERMGVPGYPGVYVLGTFARHVTFYSQQVRALNLVDSLCSTGRVTEGGSIAVVGAGLAGLTTAAAAVRRGLHVHLVERTSDPAATRARMPLQIDCKQRWIDPFVYDWPHTSGTGEGVGPAPEAGLPVLSWSAASAEDVRAQVLENFGAEVAAAEAGGQPAVAYHHRHLTEQDIRYGPDGTLSLRVEEGADPLVMDAVVLAVGFGVEAEPETRWRYWSDNELGGDQAENKSYLVSGAGDGGLTDVMRLCIAEFSHRKVLSAFRGATEIGVKLDAAVRGGAPDFSPVFLQAAGEIDSLHAREQLHKRDTTVYLTGSPQRLFASESGGSILNRLIVAWLLRQGWFKLVDAAYGDATDENGRSRVAFTTWGNRKAERLPCPQPRVWGVLNGEVRPTGEPTPERFDRVVVRHGPGEPEPATDRRRRPVEVCFPGIWKASEDNLSWWRDMPHWDDWTRLPAWAPDTFGDPPPPLDPPLGARPLYVVVEHGNTGRFVSETVRVVLEKAQAGDPDTLAGAVRVHLDVEEAFSTPHRLGRAVRILCRAHVAVFDVTPLDEEGTKFAPETMLLLGIRAVARHSLTVVTSRFRGNEPVAEDAPFHVPLLPFLLRDVSVYGWRKESAFIDRLKKAVEEGLARARRLGPIYRDLPAYEEVRRLGPDPDDFRDQPPDEIVLFLASFEAGYRDKQGDWLRSRVGTVARGERIYIVNSPSPERTPTKLYAAIRRVQMCVVDWTTRSPNVFFELGVRLAVNPRPPVCVVQDTDGWENGDAGLFALFRPLVYAPTTTTGEAFEARLRERRTALGQRDSAAAWPLNDALVSPDFVYRQVEAAVAPEAGGPVWQELRTAAQHVLGTDPDQVTEFRGLFGDSPGYRRHAEESARDRLLAAWYYLDQRHGLSAALNVSGTTVPLDDPPWSEWFDMGTVLVRELAEDAREDAGRIRDTIKSALRRAESFSTGGES